MVTKIMREWVVLRLRWGKAKRRGHVEAGMLLGRHAIELLLLVMLGLTVSSGLFLGFGRPDLETRVFGIQRRRADARRLGGFLMRRIRVRAGLFDFERYRAYVLLGSTGYQLLGVRTFLWLWSLALDRKGLGLARPPFPILFVSLAFDFTFLALEARWFTLVALESFRFARYTTCHSQPLEEMKLE